jgi:phage-related protein
MKPLVWVGDSKKSLMAFPSDARHDAGFELANVQQGIQASDFKPMSDIGRGVEEIRIWAESGTYRVIYIARFAEAVYVLHAFQKKTQQTSPRDIVLARSRYEKLVAERTS